VRAAYSMCTRFFNSGIHSCYGKGAKDCVAPTYCRRRLVE
jgi:hypothetical protein